MTAPRIPDGDDDRLARIQRNVQALKQQGASDAEVAEYLESVEGLQPSGPGPLSAREKIAGGVDATMQGPMMGFLDEAGAAIGKTFGALTGRKTDFRTMMESARAPRDKFAKQHPVADAGLGIAGSMLAPGAAVGAVGGGLKGLAAAIGMGSASAAMSGAGEAKKDRVQGAIQGGVVGGALGAAVPIFGPAVGRASSKIGASEAAKRFATSKLGQRLGRSVSNAVPGLSPKERADEMLLEGLRRGRLTPADALAYAETARKPMGLVDMGEPMSRVARAARTAGGESAERLPAALYERTAGQLGRITDDLTRTTGLTRPDVEGTLEELIETRSANARPLYERAYAHGVVDDPEVRRMVQELYEDDPALVRRLYDAAALSARRSPERTRLDPLLVRRTVRHNGRDVEVEELAPLTVRTLDHLKKGLDKMTSGMSESDAANVRFDAGSLRARLGAIRDRLDEVVPDYRAARAQWRGDTEAREAWELGSTFLRQRPEQVRAAVARMNDAERQLFRRRAIDEVFNMMGGVGDNADLTKRVAGSSNARGRLAELFDSPEQFEQFRQMLHDEAHMFRSQGTVTGGSNTADKLNELADLAGVDLPDLLQMATSPRNMLLRGASQAWTKLGQGYTRRVSDEMAPSLTAGLDGNKEELLATLKRLASTQSTIEAKRRAAARTGRGVAQAGGAGMRER